MASFVPDDLIVQTHPIIKNAELLVAYLTKSRARFGFEFTVFERLPKKLPIKRRASKRALINHLFGQKQSLSKLTKIVLIGHLLSDLAHTLPEDCPSSVKKDTLNEKFPFGIRMLESLPEPIQL